MGTPKGRLTKLEKELVKLPWQQARPAVRVKLLPQGQELYVFVESQDRLKKERAMRLRKLEQRLADLSYRPGPVDGYFDARTRQAVIAFQKWEWLSRDGVVTNSVWLKLASASGQRVRSIRIMPPPKSLMEVLTELLARSNAKPDEPLAAEGMVFVFQRNQDGADAWGEVAVLQASDSASRAS